MERVPTKEECWDKFWDVVALAHVNACRREAAEAARAAEAEKRHGRREAG